MELSSQEAKINRYSATQGVRVLRNVLAVMPPSGSIVLGAGVATTIYDRTRDKYELSYAHLQNLGTATIKYAINSDVTTSNFHEILAAGTADNDGNGASVEFRDFIIEKLSVISDAGSRIGYVLAVDTTKPNSGF